MSAKPKILILDIETSPNVLTSWSLMIPGGYLHHDNIIQERNIICAAWKWLGEKEVYAVAIDPASPTDDLKVVQTLHYTLTEADAVVAHNGDKFDIRWITARVLFHRLPPIPPIIQIDTKKIAKSKFYLNSNRLDYLAKFLGVGAKIKTDFDLWKDCMKGDVKALTKMIKYNKMDVILLEKVFNILKPYVPAKINYQLFSDKVVCPGCGSTKLQRRGFTYSKTLKYQRYQCTACGSWSKDKKAVKENNGTN